MNRYSIVAEFFVTAESATEAYTLVGNLLDSFPEQVNGHDGDVLMQEVTLEDEDVEVEA